MSANRRYVALLATIAACFILAAIGLANIYNAHNVAGPFGVGLLLFGTFLGSVATALAYYCRK